MVKSKIASWARWVGVSLMMLAAPAAHAAAAAADDAGNYTALTFTNGSNLGTGFGAWDLWNVPATLGDSTGGGGGNLNSTNGYSFRFMGTGSNDWCNGKRNFGSALAEGDVMSFTFTYNWDGGGRGVDIFCATGQFANVIDVSPGNTFKVNGTTLSTEYSPGAVVAVEVTQLTNGISVYLTRAVSGVTNLIYTTNVVNDLAASGMGFYCGGYMSLPQDNTNYAMFVNNLSIVPNPALNVALSGRDAMAAGMTNLLTLTRSGAPLDAVTFTLTSSDPLLAAVPATVDFAAGDTVTNFPIEGLGLGSVTVAATNVAYPGTELSVAVYDLGYDDAAYADEALAFTNAGSSGLGFQPWILQDNNGAGDGYTNYTGAFVGNSTFGGVDINVEGASFGLYANGDGPGNPFVNAIRPFNTILAVGQVFACELGVNFRNGSKGVALQNSGAGLFEVLVYGNTYSYKIGTNAAVDLGWAYAADSALGLEVERVANRLYNITLARTGSGATNTFLGNVDLGTTAPNEARFYNFDTDSGDSANNLYFNRLALYSGEIYPVLTLDGNDGMVVNQTNLFTVTRTGPTDTALTVDLLSSDAAVATAEVSVVIGIGQSNATFQVVSLTNGSTVISTTTLATNTVGASYNVAVVDIAYDDTTYYPPATFDNAGNGGAGFATWFITANDGPGLGFTNYSGALLGDATVASGDVNSSEGTAFALYANGDGTGGDTPLATAIRGFTELAIGQSISVDLGVNFRNGAKGVMFQNNGSWLFEVSVFGDNYHYNVRDLGADSAVSLGWAYAADSAITVIFSRTGASSYNVKLVRNGTLPEETLLEGITLSQAPNEVRFYVVDTDAGGDENSLFINRLAIFTGVVGAEVTDGIPNAWWNQYFANPVDHVATNNPDTDIASNFEEYIADTDPTNSLSFFPNEIDAAAGAGLLSLQTGPTTNSRVYDVWWTTNLLAAPQTWTRYGLTVTGNGTNVILQVTNDVPTRIYRTGVALP